MREAQATQSLPIGAPPIALTQIDLKIDSPFNPYNNRIGYGLGLKVLDSLPPNFTNITPTDLTGRPITLDNRLQTGILITNAIPLGANSLPPLHQALNGLLFMTMALARSARMIEQIPFLGLPLPPMLAQRIKSGAWAFFGVITGCPREQH